MCGRVPRTIPWRRAGPAAGPRGFGVLAPARNFRSGPSAFSSFCIREPAPGQQLVCSQQARRTQADDVRASPGKWGRGVSPARRPPEPLPNLAGRGKAAQNLLSDKRFSTCDCVSETRPPSSEQGEGAKQGDRRPRAALSAAPRGPPRRAPGRARSCARETPGVLMSQAPGSPFSVGRGARAAGRVGT